MREDLRNDESHPRDFRKSLGCGANDEFLNSADDVEAALVKLQPRPSSVNRDRLLFLAGKAAGERGAAQATSQGFSKIPGMSRRRRWTWPLATLASVAAMVVFAVLFGIERGRPVRTVVQWRDVPVALPNRAAVVTARKVERPKPPARRRDVDSDRGLSDAFSAESRLMRARHPVLATDPDLLPNSASGGGSGSVNPLTAGDTQRVMTGGLSATRAKTATSGFPTFLNSIGIGRGGF